MKHERTTYTLVFRWWFQENNGKITTFLRQPLSALAVVELAVELFVRFLVTSAFRSLCVHFGLFESSPAQAELSRNSIQRSSSSRPW